MNRVIPTLFLPCIDEMAGRPIRDESGMSRPGLAAGTRFDGDYESIRDVKGWLSSHFPPNRTYKPTIDQLPMTRMLDFDKLRSSSLPCFETLQRALTFLSDHLGCGGVYHEHDDSSEACMASTPGHYQYTAIWSYQIRQKCGGWQLQVARDPPRAMAV